MEQNGRVLLLLMGIIADFCSLGVQVTALCLLWHGSNFVNFIIACLAGYFA